MSEISRLRRKIDTYGEVFTIKTKQIRGIIQLTSSGSLRTYFDDVEMSMTLMPAYFFVTYPDADIALNDPITYQGRLMYFRKITVLTYKGKPIIKIAVVTN